MIKELVPTAKNVGIIYCSSEKNSKYQVEQITKYLNDLGITEFGTINMSGFAYGDTPMNPQLIVNGKRQVLARYPDKDYLYISKVIESGPNLREKPAGATIADYKGQGMKFRYPPAAFPNGPRQKICGFSDILCTIGQKQIFPQRLILKIPILFQRSIRAISALRKTEDCIFIIFLKS